MFNGFKHSPTSTSLPFIPSLVTNHPHDESYEPHPSCAIAIDANILLLQRDTFANLFHNGEDFFNTFLAYSILEWNLEDSAIWITDLYPTGPFYDIWSKVFSSKVSTRKSKDGKRKVPNLRLNEIRSLLKESQQQQSSTNSFFSWLMPKSIISKEKEVGKEEEGKEEEEEEEEEEGGRG